jgi:sterol desaturase/sphingolipid hydroxylase (fatty acid hydroxylase superfamily)
MATQWHLWVRPEWMNGVTGFAIDFIVLDLFIYCWHRAVHEIQFLWRFHEVHHMDHHLDTTSAIRFHFGEVFFSTLARIPLIMVFAIPFSSIVIFEAIMFLFVLFHHSNLKLPETLEKYIAKIIVTPSLHWVHHHAVRADTDSNYGTVFSFWDKIFKSKSKTLRFDDMPIGVQGLKDKEFLKLLVRPFRGLFNIR